MGFLEIDGTLGEGGGSITRLAAGFSILFMQPIHLCNIRASRKPPGLRLQHKLGLESLQKLTNGNLSPIEVGTTELKFTPGTDWKNSLQVNIRTAGSISLLSQTIQTACIRTKDGNPIRVEYRGGGTFGMGAPDPYYLNNVTYQLFQKMGLHCNIEIIKNGFYPKGGASAILHVQPVQKIDKIKPLELDKRGNLQKIRGFICCSQNLQKPKVAERILKSIISALNTELNLSDDIYEISVHYEPTLNPGVGVCVWAIFENTIIGTGTILGKRGVPSEIVGKQVANKMIEELSTSATIDCYAADQLIPLMVLCPEKSEIVVREISSHLRTNIALLERFHPHPHKINQIDNGWKIEYE
jgi:RNA 3'-terminal phosphate cyclase (ATP)/RNA 3'-terminal phosphate cyclase (GTP)